MKSESIFTCPICNTEYDIAEYLGCPKCEWEFQGHEDIMTEDEICPYHLISICEAKKNYANGLNVWGKPLKQ